MTRTLVALLLLALPGAAHATPLQTPADWMELCRHATPATEAFDLPLWRGSVARGDDAPEPVGLGPWIDPVETEPEEVAPCTDPVITTLRARDYARSRGAYLLDSYEVVVDASQFTIDDGAIEAGELMVPLPPAVDATGGGTWLAFGHATTLRFDVGADTADAVLTRHALGAVSLRLVFTLATRSAPDRAYCGQAEDGSMVVFGRLVEAELVDALTQVTQGRTVTASYVDEQVRALAAERAGTRGVDRPIAEVTAIELTGTLGCSEDEAAVVQSVVETLATQCYVGGLARNSQLSGAVVLAFDIDAAGWIATYELATDAVSNRELTACLEESVRRIRLAEPPTSDGLAIRTTVVFRTEGRRD